MTRQEVAAVIENVEPPGLYIVPPMVPLAPPLGHARLNRAQGPNVKSRQCTDWAEKWSVHFQSKRREIEKRREDALRQCPETEEHFVGTTTLDEAEYRSKHLRHTPETCWACRVDTGGPPKKCKKFSTESKRARVEAGQDPLQDQQVKVENAEVFPGFGTREKWTEAAEKFLRAQALALWKAQALARWEGKCAHWWTKETEGTSHGPDIISVHVRSNGGCLRCSVPLKSKWICWCGWS